MREGLEKTHQDSPDSPGRPRNRPRIGPGIGRRKGFQDGLRASDGAAGASEMQEQRSEGQDERGKAAGGLQPMETGAFDTECEADGTRKRRYR